jgi:hypothetical protein
VYIEYIYNIITKDEKKEKIANIEQHFKQYIANISKHRYREIEITKTREYYKNAVVLCKEACQGDIYGTR